MSRVPSSLAGWLLLGCPLCLGLAKFAEAAGRPALLWVFVVLAWACLLAGLTVARQAGED